MSAKVQQICDIRNTLVAKFVFFCLISRITMLNYLEWDIT